MNITDIHEEPRAEKPARRNQKQVGSSTFLILVTAIISITATFLTVYYVNEGVIFVGKTRYGDLRKVYGVSEVIDNIDENYYPYNDVRPTDEDLEVIAMKAIVDSLEDTYAAYYTTEEYVSTTRGLRSSFKGLGIQISESQDGKGLYVSKVYEGSPAEKAGIAAGDIIVSVNNVTLEGLTFEDAKNTIGGEEGEAVFLGIMRGSMHLEITAYYGEFAIQTVSDRIIDNHIGYIYIVQFAENTAKEFKEKLAALREQNIDSLIVDIRNNPGGYLDVAVDIADELIDEGVIVYTGKSMDDRLLMTYKAKKGGLGVPLVMLVNSDSASASEILAAAVKENNAGLLMGETTYGKGIVQTTGKLYSREGYLKLTTSGYFTPNGNNIHGKGVKPDMLVYMPEGLREFIGTSSLSDSEDEQLMHAVQWINGNK